MVLIFCKTGLVEHIATNLEDTASSSPISHTTSWTPVDPAVTPDLATSERSSADDTSSVYSGLSWWWGFGWGRGEENSGASLLEHTQLEGWRGLSHKFWPRLFALYNISLPGRWVQTYC
jgi:hypothetical protein